jgi:hypothetical protein
MPKKKHPTSDHAHPRPSSPEMQRYCLGFRPPQHHVTAPLAVGTHTELRRHRILQCCQPPHTPSGSGDALSSWRGSPTAGATEAAAPSSPTSTSDKEMGTSNIGEALTIDSLSSGRLPLQRVAALPPTGSMASRTCRPRLHGVPHLPPAAPWRPAPAARPSSPSPRSLPLSKNILHRFQARICLRSLLRGHVASIARLYGSRV